MTHISYALQKSKATTGTKQLAGVKRLSTAFNDRLLASRALKSSFPSLFCAMHHEGSEKTASRTNSGLVSTRHPADDVKSSLYRLIRSSKAPIVTCPEKIGLTFFKLKAPTAVSVQVGLPGLGKGERQMTILFQATTSLW